MAITNYRPKCKSSNVFSQQLQATYESDIYEDLPPRSSPGNVMMSEEAEFSVVTADEPAAVVESAPTNTTSTTSTSSVESTIDSLSVAVSSAKR